MKIIQNNGFKNFKGIFYWSAFFTFSHSLIIFFWDLKSLLLRFSISEILGYLSYHFAFSLAESLIIALVVVAVTYIIPIKHVRSNIQATGALLVISLVINGLIFKEHWQLTSWLENLLSMNQNSAEQIVQFLWLYSITGLPITSIILTKYQKVDSLLISFTENLSILGGTYFVLGIVGILNVIYRNLP